MLIFDTHVHVDVEDRSRILLILEALLIRAVHLQCLSASSSFRAGADTGYADNRTMIFQQLPTVSTPEQFSTWEQLESYTRDLAHTGVIENFIEIHWGVCSSSHLGTIKVRACDAAMNLTELAGVVALTQCLMESFSCTLDRGEELDALPDRYVAENKWRPARCSMDVILIVNPAGEEELMEDTVERMLTELAPVIEGLGCAAELDSARTMLETGVSYQRQITTVRAYSRRREATVGLLLAEARVGRPLRPTEVFSLAAKS